MLVDLDPADPRPVYRQIVDEVRRCVSIGVVKADEPLPAIRKLADQLKVNANTVQHAYRTLEQAGDVYVKRGLGTFVRTPDRQRGRPSQSGVARQLAERMLREAFRHGLLASDLITALEEIAPGRPRTAPHPPGSDPDGRLRTR